MNLEPDQPQPSEASQERMDTEVKRLSFLLGLTQQLQTSDKLKQMAQFALEYLVEVMGAAFGDVKVIQSATDTSQASAQTLTNQFSAEFVAICGQPAVLEMQQLLDQGIPYGQGLLWQVVETGNPRFVSDYANQPNAVPAFRHPAIGQLGIFPIPQADGQIIGTLTLESRSLARLQAAPQQDMLLAACRMLGAAIERARAYERLAQLNQDLAHRAEELEAANQELEAFSYSVSHDLRAPLRAMHGFSRVLLERYHSQLPAQASHYLNRIQHNAQTMGNLVDDLLTFSRLSRQPLQKQSVAPADLVQRGWMDLQADWKNRQVEFLLDQLPLCQADPLLLMQVWINLLSNALKFTSQQPVAQIQVGCQQVENRTTYFVKDNGVGFDMNYVHKLFGVFQRLHSPQEYEGTGVGLAIVQRVIHRHGGQVWAEAAINQGASFYFTLPEPNNSSKSRNDSS